MSPRVGTFLLQITGHCIPKDPWLLIANAGSGFEPQLVPAARAINDGMPLHVAGLTVEALVTQVGELGAEVVVHDPYVAQYRGNLEEMVRGCDAVVLMVAHDAYRAVDLGRLRTQVARPILIDGRHVFSAEQARAAGWQYYGVGC